MQHINAVHTRATAAAAAGCTLVPTTLHPAVEALDVLGMLPGPLTDSCSSKSGLAEPSSWGSAIPVQLLPMMHQVKPACCEGQQLRGPSGLGV